MLAKRTLFPRSLLSTPVRSFSTHSSSNWNDFLFTTFQESFKLVEQVKDFLAPEDLQPEETKEQIVQQILRSNHLAQSTMREVSRGVEG